jgi:hypothetical protein
MNTETGRIYSPEQHRQLLEGVGTEREVSDLLAGRIVPVSKTVAQKVRLGERELNRRQRRARARRS